MTYWSLYRVENTPYLRNKLSSIIISYLHWQLGFVRPVKVKVVDQAKEDLVVPLKKPEKQFFDKKLSDILWLYQYGSVKQLHFYAPKRLSPRIGNFPK